MARMAALVTAPLGGGDQLVPNEASARRAAQKEKVDDASVIPHKRCYRMLVFTGGSQH